MSAQSTAPTDTVAEARRLRDAGDYAAASALLGPYVASHPEDDGTARMAALMAYWAKDVTTARATYETAMARHANGIDLRVEFTRFLMDVGDTRRARAVITPVVETAPRFLPGTRQAVTLLGTLDYWAGDFTRARRHFVEALRLDSADATARRQLREIDAASASWVSASGSGWHDDQPLDRATVDVEGGWFASPVTPLGVRIASSRFSHDGASETVSRAEATFRTFLPAARLDVSATGGVLSRTFDESSDWTASASLGVRLPGNVVLEGSFERAPYLNTVGSLATAVTTRSIAGTVRWRARNGWMADATVRREAFDDDNSMMSAYAWLLAPVVRRSGGELQLGYSFAAQAAEHSRFVPRPEDVNFPPGNPPSTVRGIYTPYYTPRDLRVHSLLLATALRPTPRWSLTANGSYGVHVRDDAPVLVVIPNPPNASIVRAYYPREFTPWNARAALEGAATDAVRLALTAEHGKGAYYSFSTVGVRLTYTFIAAARRRADRY
jgi:hypothetical protein